MQKNVYQLRAHTGLAALLIVVIIGAAALIVVTGVLMRRIGAVTVQDDVQRGNRARMHVESCAEEGLEQLRQDPTYRGGQLEITGVPCILSVDRNNNEYMLAAVSTDGEYTASATITVLIEENDLTILSWNP